MDFDKLTSNLNSEEFKRYLKYYETFHVDRKKCIKSKKCDDIYEETPTQLKVVKGGKEKIVIKPKYIFIDQRVIELKNEINKLEREIRNFRFIVESNTTKKIADEFSKVKEEYLSKQNELLEIEKYLIQTKGGQEAKDSLIEVNSSIMELENQKRNLYFEIQKETDSEVRKNKIKEYIDNSEILKLKKEKTKLEDSRDLNYFITELPQFRKQPSPTRTEAPQQGEEKPKKKKVIKKRCPPGQRRSKKTGECEPKEN